MKHSEAEIFDWLYKTRDSGRYNMLTEIARPLRSRFGLDEKQASEVWEKWAEDCEVSNR